MWLRLKSDKGGDKNVIAILKKNKVSMVLQKRCVKAQKNGGNKVWMSNLKEWK